MSDTFATLVEAISAMRVDCEYNDCADAFDFTVGNHSDGISAGYDIGWNAAIAFVIAKIRKSRE